MIENELLIIQHVENIYKNMYIVGPVASSICILLYKCTTYREGATLTSNVTNKKIYDTSYIDLNSNRQLSLF